MRLASALPFHRLTLYGKCAFWWPTATTIIEVVATGAHVTVALTRKVLKAFGKLDVRAQARLRRWMATLANSGPDNIPGESMKSEGRHGGFLIFAFKDDTTRLYGGYLSGLFLFLVTEFDIKKRRKADLECLQRAAKYLADYAQRGAKGDKR